MLLLQLIDHYNDLPDTKVCNRARTSDSELSEFETVVTDDSENVIATQTTKVQTDKVAEVTEVVSNDVEIVLQQFITVSDIIVFTGHCTVVQT